jgi:hypothetical protein
LLAQKVTLVSATAQSWAGGVAGLSGDNYHFTIEFTRFKNEPLPDTIWIGNNPIPLINNDAASSNFRLTHVGNTLKADITAKTSRNEYKT